LKPLASVDEEGLAAEWDAIAEIRHRQITSGVDVSYNQVLTPAILSLCRNRDLERVLDVGCGSGVLTRSLAQLGRRVVGVDLSATSIELARAWCRDQDNVTLVHSTIEEYARSTRGDCASLVVANMTLMDCADLPGTLRAIADLSAPGSYCVGTITHPCFWPIYWGYAREAWFEYDREIAIRTRFAIQHEESELETTHFHRPVTKYLRAFSDAGFRIDVLDELGASERPMLPWHGTYPKFLGFRLVRNG